MDLWGFNRDRFSRPSDQALRETLDSVGMDKLETVDATRLRKRTAALQVDLSSIAQGYSVSRLAALLERHGIRDYVAEIGGELSMRGHRPDGQPWRIAVEKPLSGQRSIEKVITAGHPAPLAVMTSGTYRHYFDVDGTRYSHILDARSGRPVTHRTVSVTVIYHDATQADAWSTALLCLGTPAGLPVADAQGIPALFIDQDQQGGLHERWSRPLADMKGIRIQ